MNKKLLKRQVKKERTIKELALILSAFSFMFEALSKNADDEDRGTDIYRLSKYVCSQLAQRIKTYGKLQRLAIDKWNDLESLKNSNHNLFLSGVSLLASHAELKGKNINTNLNKEIEKIQNHCYLYFDCNEINDTLDWADSARIKLGL